MYIEFEMSLFSFWYHSSVCLLFFWILFQISGTQDFVTWSHCIPISKNNQFDDMKSETWCFISIPMWYCAIIKWNWSSSFITMLLWAFKQSGMSITVELDAVLSVMHIYLWFFVCAPEEHRASSNWINYLYEARETSTRFHIFAKEIVLSCKVICTHSHSWESVVLWN